MSVQKFEPGKPAGKLWEPRVELTFEEIDRLVANARRLRSEVIVGGLLRGVAAVRRFASRLLTPRDYGAANGARP